MQNKNDGHDGQADDHQHLAQFRQPSLEWCRLRRGAFQQPGDVPQFGVHAGRDHEGTGLSRCGHGSHVNHVAAVAQRRVVVQQTVRILVHGDRFAGQRRFLNAHAEGGQQTRVGRDVVTCFQLNAVPRHQLARGNHLQDAVANGLGHRR